MILLPKYFECKFSKEQTLLEPLRTFMQHVISNFFKFGHEFFRIWQTALKQFSLSVSISNVFKFSPNLSHRWINFYVKECNEGSAWSRGPNPGIGRDILCSNIVALTPLASRGSIPQQKVRNSNGSFKSVFCLFLNKHSLIFGFGMDKIISFQSVETRRNSCKGNIAWLNISFKI